MILACRSGNLETVKFLHTVCSCDLNDTDKWGRNCLLFAASRDDTESIEIMKYIDSHNHQLVFAKDNSGESAFTLACKNSDLTQ